MADALTNSPTKAAELVFRLRLRLAQAIDPRRTPNVTSAADNARLAEAVARMEQSGLHNLQAGELVLTPSQMRGLRPL